jgi:RHS repeat-associated protein
MSPCFAAGGSFTTDVADLRVATVGMPIEVRRVYNSALPVDGPFGVGWTATIASRLFYSAYMFSAPSTYKKEADITMPDGTRFRFMENADGITYAPPAGRSDTLVKNGDSTYDLTPQRTRQKYHFSSTGTLLSMTDEHGNALNFTYDGNGRLQQVGDGAGSGRYVNIFYGANGRVSSLQDSAGRQVQYTYDPTTGVLTTVTDAANRVTTYGYTLTGTGYLLASGTDNFGRGTLTATYDAMCHPQNASTGGELWTYSFPPTPPYQTRKAPPGGINNSWRFTWDPITGLITDRTRLYGSTQSNGPTYHTDYTASGQFQQTVDEVGIKTFYTYDGFGNVATVTRDYQGTQALRFDYAYDPNFRFNVVSITPKNPSDGSVNLGWQAWKYDYYQTGSPSPGSVYHVYRVKDDGTMLEAMATYVYNSKGQVTQYTSASGVVTDYTYDASWNLWKVTGPSNNDGGTRPVTTYGYDNLGRVTSVQDALAHTTSYLYDNVDRITSVTLPKPSTSSMLVFTTTYSYDNYDATTGLTFTNITDPNGKITKQGYDQWGRLVQAIDAQSHVTAYGYNNEGLLVSITDANGNVTTYDYDDLTHELLVVHFADGNTESYDYNDDGTLAIFYSREGWRRNWHDHLKRVYRRDSGAPYFDFTYVGQKLTQVVQGTGYGWTQMDTMTYDHSYRLDTVTEGTRGTIDYGYNADDSRATYAVSGGPTATYAYYPDGSLNTISWTPVSGNFKYRYTLDGQYQSLTYPNGGTRNYTYDDQGRLTQLTNLDPIAGNLATYAYGYDYNYTSGLNTMLGQRSSMTATVPSQSLSSHLFKYEYDSLYQLNKVTYPNVAPLSGEVDSWTYDPIGNRLTSTVNGSTKTHAYGQVSGHTWQRITSDGVNSYASNPAGDITTRNGVPGNFMFAWNIWGQLATISGAASANYYYDHQGRRFEKNVSSVVTDYLYDGLNLTRETQGATTTDYLLGPGIDEPIALSRAGSAYYYGVDGLGSVSVVANSSGATQTNYLYDAWGNTRNTPTNFANPFTYTARETGEIGLLFYRARYYQPSVGRFVSEDPAGVREDTNFFRYTLNQPTYLKDPSGLTVYQCFRPLGGKGRALTLLYGMSVVGVLAQPPVPGVSLCGLHSYVYNTDAPAGHRSWGYDPHNVRPESGPGTDTCWAIPEPMGSCLWQMAPQLSDPKDYNLFLNNCQVAINRAMNYCRSCDNPPQPLWRIPGLANPDNH